LENYALIVPSESLSTAGLLHHERRFNTIKVPGAVIDENRAMCVIPPIDAAGDADLFVEVDGGNDLLWKRKFFEQTPVAAP